MVCFFQTFKVPLNSCTVLLVQINVAAHMEKYIDSQQVMLLKYSSAPTNIFHYFLT